MLYNVEELLKDLKLTSKEKECIISELRDDFPQDEMLFELHLYRLVQFLKKQNESKK